MRRSAESLLTAVARLEGGETPVAGSSSPSASSTAIDEHRRLFGYQTLSSLRCGRRTGTQSGQCPRKRVMLTTRSGKCNVFPVKNTLTKLFVCLSQTNDQEVPATSGKISLSFVELDVFQKDCKASHVFEKRMEEFPPLAECGGFEILRTMENSAQRLTALPVPPGGYTVAYLKSILGH